MYQGCIHPCRDRATKCIHPLRAVVVRMEIARDVYPSRYVGIWPEVPFSLDGGLPGAYPSLQGAYPFCVHTSRGLTRCVSTPIVILPEARLSRWGVAPEVYPSLSGVRPIRVPTKP